MDAFYSSTVYVMVALLLCYDLLDGRARDIKGAFLSIVIRENRCIVMMQHSQLSCYLFLEDLSSDSADIHISVVRIYGINVFFSCISWSV